MRKVVSAHAPQGGGLGFEDMRSLFCCSECEKVDFVSRHDIHARAFGPHVDVRMYSIAELSGDRRKVACSWCGKSVEQQESAAAVEPRQNIA